MQIVIGLVTLFVLWIGILLFKHLKQDTGPPPKAMADVGNFLMSNANSVLLVVFFIFGVIVIGALYDWNFDPPVEKEVTNVVTYEGMSNKDVGNLCSSNNSKNEIEENCSKLTETNCKSVGCCVYLNNEKCVSGNQHGPQFLSDSDGNKINVDNYYFKNKCNGNC